MTTALATLTSDLAIRFGIKNENATELMNVLKNTAFKSKDPVSDSQMTALLIVSKQYGLNPFTKEIYAYPDKNNGIVPVVGVDGWSRIINDHPQMDGIEFSYSDETVTHKGKECHKWVECIIYRKDRSKPTIVREYFGEVVRSLSFATPWDSHPSRMHRHKALIQCSRIAFGFSGVFDEDEAYRIVHGEPTVSSESLNPYPDEKLRSNLNGWAEAFKKENNTAESMIEIIQKRYTLTEKQKQEIRGVDPKLKNDVDVVDVDFVDAYEKAEE